MTICPLCGETAAGEFFVDKRRQYQHCSHCGTVFVPASFHLQAEQEKAEYDLHRNHVDDPGYRRFLQRLLEPLQLQLSPAAAGLDFGCGPGPALAEMLRERGFRCALYDLFYFPDTGVFSDNYDFITATEVVEHLARPRQELERLWGCLKPGGILAVMTKRVRDQAAFRSWHYKNDPTHITFFSETSFLWLARQWSARLDIVGDDVVFLHKPL